MVHRVRRRGDGHRSARLDWGVGAIHYWRAEDDGIAQAEAFVRVYERAGVQRGAAFWPAIDIERADQPANLSKARLEDAARCAEKIAAELGCKVICYGGALIRDLGVTSRLGCELEWVADYGARLLRAEYESIGFSLDKLFGWQGVGVEGHGKVDGAWALAKTTPIGDADLSALTIAGGGEAGLAYVPEQMFAAVAR